MNEHLPPARPHHKLTDDGKRMREVLSYSRRGSRLTPKRQDAWDAYADRWVIPDEVVDQPGFSLAEWFGREAPLIIEIGPGVGEATGVLAAARPEANVLALEVWKPGVAAGLDEVAKAGAENVRFCSVDAAWVMEHVVGAGELAELWTFF
ncbi:MAG: tRNA (guanine-N7)-methyltransferase, partial [Myxococcales bacterium]